MLPTPYTQLRSFCEQILTVDDLVAIHATLTDMRAFFANITGLEQSQEMSPEYEDSFLNGGIAIAPYYAATCVTHHQRTIQFVRGIHQAIRQLQQQFAGERIRILYGGCGPYATLLLPLTTQFSASDIEITLLDYHAYSIEAVQQLVSALGVDEYVTTYVQADAITYTHPAKSPPHLIVVETMLATLGQETQVAVTHNLLPQLIEGGIFVPELITVSADLVDLAIEPRDELQMPNEFGVRPGWQHPSLAQRTTIGEVMALNHETATSFLSDKRSTYLKTLTMPPHPAGATTLLLQTHITVFDQHQLDSYMTRLTVPIPVTWWENLPVGTPIEFYYRGGYNPGIELKTPQMSEPRLALSSAIPPELQKKEEALFQL